MGLHRRLFQSAAERAVPLAAHIDLTYRCNFRCTHCYLPDHGGPEMSTEQVESLLRDLAAAGTIFLVFSGGEVFLRRDLYRLLSYAKRLGFHIRLFTDGYFIDASAADRLAQLKIPLVEVSLYSTDPVEFEEITQVPGSHRRVLSGIELLRSRGIAVTVKLPVMKKTASHAADVVRWARALGCETRFDTAIIPKRDGCSDPVLEHTLDRASQNQVVSEMLDLHDETIRFVDPKERFEQPLCGAGRSTVHIEPSGRVNPCVILPMEVGHVLERPFQEIWRDSPKLAEIRSYRHKDRKGCHGCMNYGFCGFCMGRAYTSTGDPLSPAGVLCHQAHTKAAVHRGIPSSSRSVSAGAPTPWERLPAVGSQDRSAANAPLVTIRAPREKPSALSRAATDSSARTATRAAVGDIE